MTSPSPSPQEVDALRRQLVRAVERTCPRWLAAEADDMVQDALLRVLEIRRRREGETEFSSFYLRRAAYSVVVDEIRRRRRRGEVSLDSEAEGEEPVRPSADPDPEETSESWELGRAIARCLEGLIRPRRLAATLHLQGHRIREVGELMGWSAKKAENLIYRGLADLRECLQSQGFAP